MSDSSSKDQDNQPVKPKPPPPDQDWLKTDPIRDKKPLGERRTREKKEKR